ncbi:MAG TPA: cation:proton antiporter [Candidatus Saccharimonadales bacterium]|nr:cation:proton antiporter [Candidatus Saccharimonadales bacterium]
MHASIFSELSLIIAVSAAMAMVMRAIRQPLIIGHILTGILVGPSVLHLIQSPETIEVFSNIGIALLLFIIGLGLNPKVIKEVGKVATLAGVLQVVLTAAFAYGGGIILGLTRMESIFFGVALSFSSTIIILKLLSDKKEQNRLYGKVSTGMLLVQDVLATIALLFVTSQSDGGISTLQLFQLIGKGLAIGVPLLLIGNFVLPKLHRFIASSQELLFLFAIGWGFGSAALFELSGFSIEVGALLAGVALASLPYTQEISARLRPLRDFFIVVFFISLGARLNFVNFSQILPAIIIATTITIIFKPIIVMGLMGLMGYTKRTSFKAATAMAQVSEFSLVFVILGNKSGLIGDDLVAIITLVALITIAISTYLIIYADKLFVVLENDLSLFERRKSHVERESRSRYDLILFGYQKGGHEFLKVFQSLKMPYVLIDYDPDVIDILETHRLPYLYGDANDVELLEEAGIEKAKLIVSTMTDHETNTFIMSLLNKLNPDAVVIVPSESLEEAAELYKLGASYVIMPHFIGSEKIGAFIRRNGLKKSEFKKYRERHLAYLKSLYSATE